HSAVIIGILHHGAVRTAPLHRVVYIVSFREPRQTVLIFAAHSHRLKSGKVNRLIDSPVTIRVRHYAFRTRRKHGSLYTDRRAVHEKPQLLGAVQLRRPVLSACDKIPREYIEYLRYILGKYASLMPGSMPSVCG